MAATNRDFIAELDAAIGCQQCGGPLDSSPSDDFCSPSCQTAWSAARTQPLTSYREPDDQPAHVANLVELHSPETCISCVEGRRRRKAIDAAMAAALAYGSSYVVVDEITGFLVPSRNARRELLNERVQRNQEQVNRLSQMLDGPIQIARVGEPADSGGPNWHTIGTAREPVAFGFDPATREGGGSIVAVHRRDGVDHMQAILSPGAVVFPPEFADRMRAVAEEVGQAWVDAWRDISEALVPIAEQLQRSGLIEEQPPTDPRERALWLRRNRNTGPSASARAPRTINPRRGR